MNRLCLSYLFNTRDFKISINWFTIRTAVIASIGGNAFRDFRPSLSWHHGRYPRNFYRSWLLFGKLDRLCKRIAKGNAPWRIPLGIQCFGTLLIGIAPIFLPYTLRWRKLPHCIAPKSSLAIRSGTERPHRRSSRSPPQLVGLCRINCLDQCCVRGKAWDEATDVLAFRASEEFPFEV